MTALDRYQGLMFHDAGAHAPSADGKQLVLDRQQWSQIENCSIVHAAFLRAYSVSRRQDASAMPPRLHEQEIFQALEHASRYGIDNVEDRILFATHAIQLGHTFHASIQLQAVWAMTAAGSYYGAALEDVSGKPADQLHEFISTPA